MKPAAALLLLATGITPLAGAAEPRPASRLSAEVKERIRESLPAYQTPSARNAPSSPIFLNPPTDPEVFVLPKLSIRQRRLPPDAAEHMENRDKVRRMYENVYLDEMASLGELNYLLNSITIPFLSPSKAARGRAIKQRRELQRYADLADAVERADPAGAAALREELGHLNRLPADHGKIRPPAFNLERK